MVLEIIAAAVLIAFGIQSIYFSVEEGVADEKLAAIMAIGVICLLVGVWLIISTLTLGVLLKKLGGLLLTGVGIFLAFGFPDIADYQRFEMSRAGIFIGLILAVIGIYFLLF